MWLHVDALAKADRNSGIDALFIRSLNEMFDLQTSRVTVFTYRIPAIAWNALYFITILSMVTAGYQAGLSGEGSFRVGLVLALTFATAILLIADLDRATEGRLKVGQQPMIDLQQKLNAPEAAGAEDRTESARTAVPPGLAARGNPNSQAKGGNQL